MQYAHKKQSDFFKNIIVKQITTINWIKSQNIYCVIININYSVFP